MSPSIALLAAASSRNEIGGAERFFRGLCDALNGAGCSAELVPILNDEAGFANIQETYLRYYDLDLSRFDGVISAKAPAYVVRHPNHVCYLMHTMRVFYDMFDFSFPTPTAKLRRQRQLVRAWDRAALTPPRTRKVLAIGEEVADRLYSYSGLKAEVVRHPSPLQGLRPGAAFDYLFLPGRLHKWKRVHLAIEAMRFVNARIPLLISGTGEHEPELRALAAKEPRIRFLGRVSDEKLVELYAGALAVLFTPQREDLGLVTLEAFMSGKPVITCVDSGEPARLVVHGANGFVCPPDPAAIAARIDQLAADKALAARLGAQGRDSVADITWDGVVSALVAALGFGVAKSERVAWA
jgi:glycosyltransferase involved in cell wall biosynthesis